MTDNEQLQGYKKWFANYVAVYTSGREECMMVKDEHTRRVCHNIVILAKSLELSQPDQNLAEIIALFHDLGRFEQFKKYSTFNDSISENHSLLAVNILREFDVLKDLKSSEQDFIFRCILNHNRYKISEPDSEKAIFFSKLIRDADKIDIYRVLAEFYQDPQRHSSVLNLDMPDNQEYSTKIMEALLNQRIAELQFAKTTTDFKLLQMSWVYDLNFDMSFQLIEQQCNLQKIMSSLPNSREMSSAKKQVIAFFDKKLKAL